MAGPPCHPGTACFCATNPTHPSCKKVNVSIEGGIWILLVAGLILGIMSIRKMKLNEK